MRLVSVNRPAELAGLAPGQALADARALEPRLHVADAEPASDERALAALADWCGRYSPWTAAAGLETAGAGGIWVDISGCAHLFGGEESLLADLQGRLSAHGYAARTAVADTPGAAWAAARFGEATPSIVPPGGQEAHISPLPIACLRLTAIQREGLDRLGLRQVADLLKLPRAGLAARFGTELPLRLDQVLGRVEEPISPRQPVPSLRVRMVLPEPLERLQDIQAAARRLLDALGEKLEAAGRGARSLDLALYRTGGHVDRIRIGTSAPSRDTGHLMRLLDEKLDRVPEGPPVENGVELLILSVLESNPLTARQSELARTANEDSCQPDAGWDETALARLVDRLSNRLGTDTVVQLRARESHLPERAQLAVPASQQADKTTDALWASLGACRPVRLLPRPEPVTATAPIPDDPPAMFRWRGRLHRVVHADGPERLSPEWWRPSASLGAETRDYYRVEDTDGQRFWLYRAGPYRSPEKPPQWYLHGFFS